MHPRRSPRILDASSMSRLVSRLLGDLKARARPLKQAKPSPSAQETVPNWPRSSISRITTARLGSSETRWQTSPLSLEVSMQEHSRKENPRSAEEWKRKFLTETKVNQELGRRLRDLKKRLEDESSIVDRLRKQLDSQKAEPAMTQSCEKCTKLELEVARLRKLLVQHHIEVNDEDSLSIHSAPPQNEDQETMNPLRRSHSILVRQQSGRIQCLRDMLDELTPRVDGTDTARRKSLVMLSQPFVPPIQIPDQVSAPKQAAIPPPQQHPPPVMKPPAISSKEHPPRQSNQSHDVNAALENALHGIEDKSLGDLFKYAIVLTGPMPRPKKSALSAFFKNADFRRSKSLQDGSNVSGDISQSRKASAAAVVPPISAQEVASSENGRTKSSEMEKVVPPGSPLKKAGWLSNIQTRFRSASTEAPPSPQNKPELAKVEVAELVAKAVAAPAPAKIDPTKPRMLAVSPPPGKGGVAELEGLVEICFPYGEKLPPLSDFSVANLKRTLQERHRTYRSPDSTFVLTIASATNHTEITYAVCVHFPLFPDEDSGAGPENVDADGDKLPSHGCISILSNYPFFSLFFKVVFGIASIWESRRKEYVQDFAIALKEKKAPPAPLTVKDFVTHFEGVMKRMKDMRVPAMGGWTRLVLAPQYTPLSFHRPHSESVKAERRMLVLEYAAPMLFALLSVDQVLFLLGCLCCERKVLVVSDHANIVSCCVLALITLLEPLTWAGPVITLLPPRLDELLEAPVPLIAGRVSINSGSIPNFSTLTKPMNGVIEMNMDQNNLCMHEEDLMRYHELKLPGCDALVHELQQHSSQLFERHLSPDFPSVEQIQACDTICSRIHRHMQSICSLATGEATTLDASSPLYCASPRRQAQTQATTVSTDPVWTRRCSEAVQDYILRFQDTQMFSMFKLQRQDEREEEALNMDDDDDDEDDDGEEVPERSGKGGHRIMHGKYEMLGEEDSGEEGDDAAECTETETLFEDEAVTYETVL